MKTRVLYKEILAVFLLSVFVRTSESLPMQGSRPGKATEKRPLFLNEGHRKGEDIFGIILKVNSARKRFSSAIGMMENGAQKDKTKDLFQGDIVMTTDIQKALENSHTDSMTLPRINGRRRGRRAASARAQDKWPIVNGQVEVPYVFEASSVADKTVIIQAMDHWHNNVPCITFVARTNQPDYISFFSGEGCYSYTGRTGGNQRISIGSGCAVLGVIAHEIGHALGFWHEQSRPDRDDYVKILWHNILTEKLEDFKMISNADTNDLGVSYDLASLMHYGPKAFSKSLALNTMERIDGSTDFGQQNGLSVKDIEQARLLYCPGTNACTTLYTDLDISCSYWSNHSWCEHQDYKPYMSANCKKSCIC